MGFTPAPKPVRLKKPNKYGAKAANGYDSYLEGSVGAWLELRQRNGEITDLKRQQTVVLQDGPPNQRIAWKVDFSFVEKGILVYAEAKGFETEDYKLKLKLWRGRRPAPLEIYKGSANNFQMTERIE